jgi:hypothetical protein
MAAPEVLISYRSVRCILLTSSSVGFGGAKVTASGWKRYQIVLAHIISVAEMAV